MKIISFSLIVLSVAALFAAGIMTMIMTTQAAEAKEKVYCPKAAGGECGIDIDTKRGCEAFFSLHCEKVKVD